ILSSASQLGGAPRGRATTERGNSLEQALRRHEGLVHAVIRREGSGVLSYEEALQAGRIGLWRALLGYDPARGTAFSTYAWVAIRRHIRRAATQASGDQRCLLLPHLTDHTSSGRGEQAADVEDSVERL
ncbi:MAG: hypothetical protein GTO63_28595, partial [Anaerolineae bacterium]|nr:hypothetical protein [Anaerolineae bacterium]NIN98733.1 hypothetical protein [Anaerolineae bacterium]NIQ81618.1 hypothetical protein [Anaerolineae bacterium]